MAEGWYKKWRPTGMDEVRRTVDAAASQLPQTDEGFPPATGQVNARIDQDNYEAVERAREEGRQEALNKDQFKEGWDAGQEAIKRQNAAKRKMGVRTSTGVRRSTPPRRFKTSGSMSKSTRNSAASAFKRRR